MRDQAKKAVVKEKEAMEIAKQKSKEIKMKDSEIDKLHRERYQQHMSEKRRMIHNKEIEVFRQNRDLVKSHKRLMAELTAMAESEEKVASECGKNVKFFSGNFRK